MHWAGIGGNEDVALFYHPEKFRDGKFVNEIWTKAFEIVIFSAAYDDDGAGQFTDMLS